MGTCSEGSTRALCGIALGELVAQVDTLLWCIALFKLLILLDTPFRQLQ